ncbi:heme-binding protein [Paraburkholderia kururiensis]|uniref:heme-binding protein n=1 Tax=Paraburkholderia kururiensis TaxID=984307 RepID=UPI0005A94177|nr:heme-binding protein [Paraburkholderia kururiensis]
MRTKFVLTREDVKKIAAAAEAHALANGWPVTIVIYDDGGHPLHLSRLDGATLSSIEMALAKGRTAALGRRESKFYEDIIAQGRVAFLSAPMTGFLEGGVPIVVAGEVVGSVGVSGVKSAEDAEIARAGIAALEL